VDLAGSERVGETGAVGEAAKEGASINNRCAERVSDAALRFISVGAGSRRG